MATKYGKTEKIHKIDKIYSDSECNRMKESFPDLFKQFVQDVFGKTEGTLNSDDLTKSITENASWITSSFYIREKLFEYTNIQARHFDALERMEKNISEIEKIRLQKFVD